MINDVKNAIKQKNFHNLGDYWDWALNQKHSIHIGHNLKGYDCFFILKYYLEILLTCESTPEDISTGCKILAIMHR